MNRLIYPDAPPWHLKATYDILDTDGRKNGHGVYEVFYAGPKKYKEVYESKQFSQTTYNTDHGAFRAGEMLGAYGAERLINNRIFARLPNEAVLQATTQQLALLPIDGPPLRCISLDRKASLPGGLKAVTSTYCLDPNNLALRYESGVGATSAENSSTTSRNEVILFHDHFAAREIIVKFADKPYVRIHVDVLEDIAKVNDADFQPPANAAQPEPSRPVIPDGIMTARLLKRVNPSSLTVYGADRMNKQVVLAIVVGKDGRVLGVRPVDGDKALESDTIKAVSQWVYRPYMISNQPVEVETEVVETFGKK